MLERVRGLHQTPLRKWLAAVTASGALAGGVIIAISSGGGITSDVPGGASDTELANVWIDENGGACIYNDRPAAYSDDRACGPIWDTGWDKLAAGDTMRVVNGNYPIQHVTGAKSTETFIVGESKAGVVVAGAVQDCRPEFGMATVFCADADNLTLERATIDTNTGDGVAPGSKIIGRNVTYRSVDIVGQWPDIGTGDVHGCSNVVCGAGFTWTRGTWGDLDPPPRTCSAPHGEPIWVRSPGVTIDRVVFNKQTVRIGAGAYCGADDVPHLEFVRLDGDADDFTLSRSVIMPGSEAGSGYIFSGSSTVDRARFLGNIFNDNVASTWLQAGELSCDSLVAYNTILGDSASIPGCIPWVGNLAVGQSTLGCTDSDRPNGWGASGSCAGNTYLDGSIGVEASGRLQADSPAIDAAERPDGDDVCTDAAVLEGVDLDGDTRPQGSACDAGADERAP